MTYSERAAIILIALNYTPKTLSAATGMSLYRAKCILTAKNEVRWNEVNTLCNVLNMTANDLFIGRVAQ